MSPCFDPAFFSSAWNIDTPPSTPGPLTFMLQDRGQCLLGHFVPDLLNRVLGSLGPSSHYTT